MLRAVAASALFATALSHNSEALCSTGADGVVGCLAADPAWVAKFSVAASGPEQYWLNLGASPDEMVVGWVTSDMTAASTVQYGTSPGALTQTANGTSDFYKYSARYTSGLIHHSTMKGLAPSTIYYYRVAGASDVYNFTSSPGVGAHYPYTIGFFADIGESLSADDTVLHMIAGSSHIDSYVLNGDISYASGCEKSGCGTWDAFQRMMSPLAAYKPIGIAIGNHEQDDDANGIVAISTQYRFAGMPFAGRKDRAMYFAYEVGPAHIISLACFYPGGFGGSSPLVQWLKSDLSSIDRSKTPWVLVSLHAPWYNSNTAHQGDGETMRVAIEPLFLAAGVNAIFTGHVHAYERSQPVANNVVMPAGQGIVHFNIGDAGASLYTSWEKTPAWSAFHSAVFGHGELAITNATAATWTWHRNVDDEKVVQDSYTILNTHTS